MKNGRKEMGRISINSTYTNFIITFIKLNIHRKEISHEKKILRKRVQQYTGNTPQRKHFNAQTLP
jgi:hypothetical protein